ncbi:MAG: peptide chain release factor N(5)-glutamine methyltransferase [bacterium]|nr:peptide chain release factor N(5)-glutamine methyltransferase [bacterium]
MIKKHLTAKYLIDESVFLMKQAGIEKPRLNAELIMAHCMNKDRTYLYSNYNKVLTRIEANYFKSLVRRRLKREPVQYIVGESEFMSLPFKINRNVLIPRPETETLVEYALNFCLENRKKSFRVLDIGCGSGNIIISIAKYAPKMTYVATDISKGALRVTRENRVLNRIKDSIHLIQSDGFSALKKKRIFDAVLSNPPYIPKKEIKNLQPEVSEFEPESALCGGEDGLDHVRNIIDSASSYMKKGGLLAVEIGFNQHKEVIKHIRQDNKYRDAKMIKDLSGIERVLTAVRA